MIAARRTRGVRAAAVLVLTATGCTRAAPAATCDGDLGGVYADEGGARWMVLDHRATLEAYPLFDDLVREGSVTGAPAVLDLSRTTGPAGPQLAGALSRRFDRGGESCRTSAPAHVLGCTAAGLELVLATPAVPLAVAPCRPARPLPSRRRRWTRV